MRRPQEICHCRWGHAECHGVQQRDWRGVLSHPIGMDTLISLLIITSKCCTHSYTHYLNTLDLFSWISYVPRHIQSYFQLTGGRVSMTWFGDDGQTWWKRAWRCLLLTLSCSPEVFNHTERTVRCSAAKGQIFNSVGNVYTYPTVQRLRYGKRHQLYTQSSIKG